MTTLCSCIVLLVLLSSGSDIRRLIFLVTLIHKDIRTMSSFLVNQTALVHCACLDDYAAATPLSGASSEACSNTFTHLIRADAPQLVSHVFDATKCHL
jgi:hypothetical protein